MHPPPLPCKNISTKTTLSSIRRGSSQSMIDPVFSIPLLLLARETVADIDPSQATEASERLRLEYLQERCAAVIEAPEALCGGLGVG